MGELLIKGELLLDGSGVSDLLTDADFEVEAQPVGEREGEIELDKETVRQGEEDRDGVTVVLRDLEMLGEPVNEGVGELERDMVEQGEVELDKQSVVDVVAV